MVLGVPVVSLLLALRARGRGAAHVGHAAAPQVGAPHHAGAGQRGLPGLALWGRHHQCGGGGRVPRGGEGHGPAGGSGVRRGSDHPLRRHLLLTHPGHSVNQPEERWRK